MRALLSNEEMPRGARVFQQEFQTVSAGQGSNQVPGVRGEGERECVIAVNDVIVSNGKSKFKKGYEEEYHDQNINLMSNIGALG